MATSADLAYQWRFNGENIPGATNNLLVLTNVQSSQSGAYVAVVFGNSISLASHPALLTIDFDSDGDGIPDSWEIAYGINPFDAGDAVDDLDADGISNRDEYISGSNPRDPRSSLKLDQVLVEGRTTIRFTAMANRTYTVEYTESLSPPIWTVLTNVPSRNSSSIFEISDPPVDAVRYYRIVTPARTQTEASTGL